MGKISTFAAKIPTQLCLGPGMGVHPSRRTLLSDPSPVEFSDASTLSEAFVSRASTSPEKVAYWFIDLDERLLHLTYSDVLHASQKIATALIGQGIGRGDKVIISMDTGPEYVCAFLACGLLGATVVPIYPPAGVAMIGPWQENLGVTMRSTGSRSVLTVGQLVASSLAVAGQFTNGFVIDCSDLPDRHDDILPPHISPDELAFIQHTSGTTSTPKGTMVPHSSLLANCRCIVETTRWKTSELIICWLPLFHDMGLVSGIVLPILTGIPSVLLPPLLFLFRPRRWLWAFHYFRGNLCPAPNFSFAICVDKIRDEEIEGLDLSDWRVAWNGAEFIHPDTIHRFSARYAKYGFKATTMFPVYGMAETVLAAAFPRLGDLPRIDTIQRSPLVSKGLAIPAEADDPVALSLVSVGRALPHHEIKIIDQSGVSLPERRQGEIILRGPSIAAGYINNEVATAVAFRKGWFHTGDLGYISDGDLFVCGRKKELIIVGGKNYHPYDIEFAVAQVNGVRQGNVAAFGVPNVSTATEDMVVLFETRIKQPEDMEKLRKEIEQTVLHRIGIRPNRIVPYPPQTLIKTSSGKIARAKIRQMYIDGKLKPGGRRGPDRVRVLSTVISTYARLVARRFHNVPILRRVANFFSP